MGRKKYNIDDKKSNFGITLNPELMKILEQQSEKEGISKSKLIEDVMREYLDNKYTLPGYMKTWFSKTQNLDDKVFLKGELLKDAHNLRTKQQIMKVA